ncbi:carboxypeptidase regulatory-like domain-containing protein [Gemmatimonas sp.]|uniref:TonB-dependent receptor n=1 Tax=Gemmatimonas sp. TaxID=1962908 RepID=UPI0035681211
MHLVLAGLWLLVGATSPVEGTVLQTGTPTVATADSVGELRGRITDATTALPVVAATVRIQGTRLGAQVDDNGRYVVTRIPVGNITVTFQRVGYATETRTVSIRADVVTTLDVTLRASAELATVRVQAAAADEREQFRLSPNLGVVNVTRDMFKRVPVIGEPDVLRVVQLLPGVVATNDFTAGYNVRGGESDQNLVLLDGYPIYNPFHLGGLFGTFIDETVGEFELIPGGFPARYGTRLSSVLSVVPRVEERSGIHGAASVSVLASTLSLAGTVRGATSWSIAARRTYADKFVSLVSDNQLPYWFTDVQAHVQHRFANGGLLSATSYVGEDVLAASLAAFGDTTQAGGGALRFDWGNTLIGVAYTQPLRRFVGGDSARLMQRLSRTGFATNLDLGSGSLTLQNRLTDARAWGEITRWRGRRETSVGYEWSSYRVTYDVNSVATSGAPLLARRDAPSAAALYVDHTVRTSRVSARLGLRGETVTGTGWAGLSPRLSLKWFANKDLAFTVGGGATSQWTPALRNEQAPIRIFDFWLVSNRSTPVARAWQQSIGGEKWLSPSRFIRVEAWHKIYSRLPASNLTNDPAVIGDEFIVTTGRSSGLDVLVRRLEREKVSGWIAYSYAVSTRDGPDGRFAPVQDRRHNVNLVSSFRPGGKYTYGARLGIGTGTPFTDVVGQIVRRRYDPITNTFETGALDQQREPIGGTRNGARFPLFQRLDVSVTRESTGRLRWAPYLSIINAYAARNVFTYVFDYTDNPPTRTAFSQFPLLPTVGVGISW